MAEKYRVGIIGCGGIANYHMQRLERGGPSRGGCIGRSGG